MIASALWLIALFAAGIGLGAWLGLSAFGVLLSGAGLSLIAMWRIVTLGFGWTAKQTREQAAEFAREEQAQPRKLIATVLLGAIALVSLGFLLFRRDSVGWSMVATAVALALLLGYVTWQWTRPVSRSRIIGFALGGWLIGISCDCIVNAADRTLLEDGVESALEPIHSKLDRNYAAILATKDQTRQEIEAVEREMLQQHDETRHEVRVLDEAFRARLDAIERHLRDKPEPLYETSNISLSSIEEAARIVREFAESSIDNARAAVAQRDFRAADRFIREAKRVGLLEHSFDIHTVEGDRFYFAGDFTRALDSYQSALVDSPRDRFAVLNVGVAAHRKAYGHEMNGELSEADRYYTLAIEHLTAVEVGNVRPWLSLSFTNRGNVRKDRGDVDAAFADYAQTDELWGDEDSVYVADMLLGKTSTRGPYLRLEGGLQIAIDEVARAIEIYRDFLSRNPEHKHAATWLVKGLSNKALLYKDTRDYGQALVLFEEALDVLEDRVPDDDYQRARVLTNQGIALSEMNRFKDAVGAYREAKSLLQPLMSNADSTSPTAHTYAQVLSLLGTALANLRQFDEALGLLEESVPLFEQLSAAGFADAAGSLNVVICVDSR